MYSIQPGSIEILTQYKGRSYTGEMIFYIYSQRNVNQIMKTKIKHKKSLHQVQNESHEKNGVEKQNRICATFLGLIIDVTCSRVVVIVIVMDVIGHHHQWGSGGERGFLEQGFIFSFKCTRVELVQIITSKVQK